MYQRLEERHADDASREKFLEEGVTSQIGAAAEYLPKIDAREERASGAVSKYQEDSRANVAEHDDANEKDWQSLRSIRDEVLKALEEARNAKLIRTGFEAQVQLTAPEPVYTLLKRYEAQLRYLFIVSAVEQYTPCRVFRRCCGRPQSRDQESGRPEMRPLLE